MCAAITETALPFPLARRGKVRDVYDLGDKLLMVASDRISAFDFVLGTPVPDKGKILTQISAWWFKKLEDIAANHLISADDLFLYQFTDNADQAVKWITRFYRNFHSRLRVVLSIHPDSFGKVASQASTPSFCPRYRAVCRYRVNITTCGE